MNDFIDTDDRIKTNLRLRVVYDTKEKEDGIYIEYDPETFKKVLIEEFEKVKNVGRAFERTCERIKKATGTL